MRTNGYVRILTVSGGGLDEFGEPEPSETAWSEGIPCSIKKNRDSSKGVYADGMFRNVSATVLIEHNRDISAKHIGKRIRLENLDDELGEFDVISVTGIPGSGRIEIMV